MSCHIEEALSFSNVLIMRLKPSYGAAAKYLLVI